MIKIENTEVTGFEAAIRGMRNPKNSWDKSDSWYASSDEAGTEEPLFIVGDNDLKLMKNLINAGTDHRKFMRMIVVTMDVTAPLYWWKEFDTYKVGTVADSCSTMHKIHEKRFTLDDFSTEHLDEDSLARLQMIVEWLNVERGFFNTTKEKVFWWQMIQLLPSSYNQRRTILLNYEVLANMYHARKNHKLDEWHDFCHWIEDLPYSQLITGKEGANE